MGKQSHNWLFNKINLWYWQFPLKVLNLDGSFDMWPAVLNKHSLFLFVSMWTGLFLISTLFSCLVHHVEQETRRIRVPAVWKRSVSLAHHSPISHCESGSVLCFWRGLDSGVGHLGITTLFHATVWGVAWSYDSLKDTVRSGDTPFICSRIS